MFRAVSSLVLSDDPDVLNTTGHSVHTNNVEQGRQRRLGRHITLEVQLLRQMELNKIKYGSTNN